MEEYFKQGEKEKELGLPCSPLCDRDNTLVAESQIGKWWEEQREKSLSCFSLLGFIQYIVEPSFVIMGDMLEKILKSLSVPDSELPSPSNPGKSIVSSPSPPPSPHSSVESNQHDGEQGENG